MGLMDKIKNMFTDVVDDEPIKKEVIQVEIPSPIEEKKKETKEVEVLKKEELEKTIELPKKEEIVLPKSEEIIPPKREEKFVFPVYFDEKDFSTIEKPKEIKKPLAESYKGKSVPVVEEKGFKPTPIISPVYGVLDKNYSKDDIKTKQEKEVKKNNTIIQPLDVDLVRNKAFGTLEDDIDTNLYVNIKITKPDEIDDEYDDIPSTPIITSHDDMEEYRKKMEEVDKEIELDNNDDLDELEKTITNVVTNDNIVSESLTKQLDELNEEINEPITESDLFDMIDTMYEEEK